MRLYSVLGVFTADMAVSLFLVAFGTGATSGTLGAQVTLNFFVPNIPAMLQALGPTSVAHSKSHVYVNAPATYMWVNEGSNNVEQHLDVEMVTAAPKHEPAGPVVTLAEVFQFSASVLDEYCIQTVDLTASCFEVDDAKCKSVMIQKSSCDSFSAVVIVVNVCQNKEV